MAYPPKSDIPQDIGLELEAELLDDAVANLEEPDAELAQRYERYKDDKPTVEELRHSIINFDDSPLLSC